MEWAPIPWPADGVGFTIDDPNGYGQGYEYDPETGLMVFVADNSLALNTNALIGVTTGRPFALEIPLLDMIPGWDPATEDLWLRVLPVDPAADNTRLGMAIGVVQGTNIVLPGVGWYETSATNHAAVHVTSGVTLSSNTGTAPPAFVEARSFRQAPTGKTGAITYGLASRWEGTGLTTGSLGASAGATGRTDDPALMNLRVVLLHAASGVAPSGTDFTSSRFLYAVVPSPLGGT